MFTPGIRAHIAGFATFLVLQLLVLIWPSIVDQAFIATAARSASMFLGSPLTVSADNVFIIQHPGIDVAVTEACSGFGFFSLLAAVLVGVAVFHQRIRDIIWLLPAAFVIGLLANTSRIVCAVHARLAAADLFSSAYDGAIHMSVGVVVFVAVLTITWILIKKRYGNFVHAS